MNPRLLISASAAVAALLAGPSAASAATPPTTAVDETVSASCATSTYGAFTTHAWDGSEPVRSCSSWRFELPAMTAPPAKRRSELWWSVAGKTQTYQEGRPLVFEADVAADLGAAAASNHDWHVLWQLHGPLSTGEWREPVMVLAVRNGVLHLQGGNGHPKHRGGASSYWWNRPLASFENNRSYRVRIETLVTRDTSRAWITASVDGVPVLQGWRPVSAAGNRPGTLYPNQPVVYSRSGLYRGTDSGYPRPTYRQTVTQRDVVVR